MSDILLMDGFGYAGVGQHTSGVSTDFLGSQWNSFINYFQVVDVDTGIKGIKGQGVDAALTSKTWGAVTEIYAAFRIFRGVTTSMYFLSFHNPSGFAGSLAINSDGAISYWATTTVCTTTTKIPLNTWAHVEVKLVLHSTTGSVDIWFNGASSPDISVSGVDTLNQGTTCDRIAMFTNHGVYSRFQPHTITDLVIHTLGAPIGDCRVLYKESDADGTDQDFTPYSGSDHYAMVDELDPDEDSTYNESDGTSGHRDDFEHDGSLGDLVDILCVQAFARARKVGSGTGEIMLGIESGGSEDQSSAIPLSESYQVYTHNVDDQPGGSGWSLAQAEAALVSYEVV